MILYVRKKYKVMKFDSKDSLIDWINQHEPEESIAKKDEFIHQRIITNQSSNLSIDDLNLYIVKYYHCMIVGKTTYDKYVNDAINAYDKISHLEENLK